MDNNTHNGKVSPHSNLFSVKPKFQHHGYLLNRQGNNILVCIVDQDDLHGQSL
jgi:hypothetical protein